MKHQQPSEPAEIFKDSVEVSASSFLNRASDWFRKVGLAAPNDSGPAVPPALSKSVSNVLDAETTGGAPSCRIGGSSDIEYICNASFARESRMFIMQEVRCSLSESAKRWRRVFNGLLLLDHLIARGCPKIFSELKRGLHFDVVQRLLFLSSFDNPSDKRVNGLVRDRAKELRTVLLDKLNSADSSGEEEETRAARPPPTASPTLERFRMPGKQLSIDSTVGSALNGSHFSPPVGSSNSANSRGSRGAEGRPPMGFNDMVRVGHDPNRDTSDESDSDSSNDEGKENRKKPESAAQSFSSRVGGGETRMREKVAKDRIQGISSESGTRLEGGKEPFRNDSSRDASEGCSTLEDIVDVSKLVKVREERGGQKPRLSTIESSASSSSDDSSSSSDEEPQRRAEEANLIDF